MSYKKFLLLVLGYAVAVVVIGMFAGCADADRTYADVALKEIYVWVCLAIILLTFFVNFFVRSWLLCFMIVFLCVYMITTNTNEWLSWIAGLTLAYSAYDGIMKIYKGV